MKEYKRSYPCFSLCGLNCGLCPRYQTSGSSRCPGCGGPDFHLKHPTCAVITCNNRHDNVEYCYQCSQFPCEKYQRPNNVDSFISYRNVLTDFKKAEKFGIEAYKIELNRKIEILEYLIADYNDGRKKNYYCLAVNLLELSDLETLLEKIDSEIKKQEIVLKQRVLLVSELINSLADSKRIELRLRKNQLPSAMTN